MKNVFDSNDSNDLIVRINKLSPGSKPQWGKMDAAKMLAHCNVTYEMVYEDKHPKPGAFKRGILKLLVKNAVVNEKPYPRNSRTAPQFIISDAREFALEKDRLINYIKKTRELGADHFEGLESHSFGPLNKNEWNNMFYKHLDHHLRQFNV